jgi:PAS domain S-box-containing protein
MIEYKRQQAVMTVARNITERRQMEIIRKRNQARLESLLRISEIKSGNSQDLLYYTLEETIKLTESKIGFLYFFDEHTHKLSVNSWSKEVMKYCNLKTIRRTFQLGETGILGQAIRQRQPVIINTEQAPDFVGNGYPGGPYQISNYLSVPIIRGKELVAVVGVASKDTDYDQIDIQQLSLLMESAWNILERWNAEEALRDSEQRYRQLIELSQDGILRMDHNGYVVMANPAACRMFSASENELVGASFAETYMPEEHQAAGDRLVQIQTNKSMRFERQAIRKDGTVFPIEVSISPLSQGFFQEVIRDITQRKRMENELQENEQKYRLLVENQTDLLAEISPTGEFLFVNPAYRKLLGKEKDQILGLSVDTLIHEDDRERAAKEFSTAYNPPYTSYSEARMITKDGWRWIAWKCNAVLDNQKNITALTCMGRDITESKQAKEELEKANKQLREIDKLKDNFLSTVSHELRTPLTSIKSFVEILLNYDEDKTTQKEFLGIINEESDRLTRLINDFLDISKIQAGRMQWKTEELSVTDAINSAVNTARPLIDKEKLTVTVNAEADLPKVLCDRDRLVQVVTNILGNAIKFTPESGKITLKAWFDKNQSLEPAAVTVSITDTGIGIAPENHHKIFENFGQVGDVLKDRPKGTGLGLPICKKIIENYKGKIWVDSDLGKGTTFLFTLPVAKPKDNCRSQI